MAEAVVGPDGERDHHQWGCDQAGGVALEEEGLR